MDQNQSQNEAGRQDKELAQIKMKAEAHEKEAKLAGEVSDRRGLGSLLLQLADEEADGGGFWLGSGSSGCSA